MDHSTSRSRLLTLGYRVLAVLVGLVLIPVVIVARENGATGGFKEAPLANISGIARVLVPTEPPTDPDVDATRWVIQRGDTTIPIDDEDARGLVPGQVVRAKYSPQDGVQQVVRAAGVSRPTAPIPQRNLLVVPVQWADRKMSDTRLADTAKTVSELTTWWSAASAGIETLTVRVAPALEVTPTKECDDYGVANQVRDWVSQSESATWVTNTALLWPEKSGCWYGGLGQMPGSFTWMNSTAPYVWAHELGHNMGLPHANSCGWLKQEAPNSYSLVPTKPSYLTQCANWEYGNRYDIMGSSGDLGSGFNVQYMNRIGWLADAQVARWDGTDRTYQLSLATATAAPLRAVQIPSTKSLGSLDEGDFWVQYRDKGPRNWVNDTAGVFLTMSPSADYVKGMQIPKGSSTGGSWLCPISEGAQGFDTKYLLQPGMSFDDRLGRFRITLESLTSDTAQLRIQPGPSRPVVTATDVTTSLKLDDAGIPTGGITVNWKASVSPDPNLVEPSIWTATVSPGGAACSVPVFSRSCTVARVPRNQPLTVTVTGSSPVGNGVTTGPGVEPVPNSPPIVVVDTTTGETSAEIRPRVEDDGGLPITSIMVAREGDQPCNATTASCAFTNLASKFTHKFIIEASNAAGARSTSVEVTTLPRKPGTPVGSVRVEGGTATITVDVDPLDRFNANSLELECRGTTRRGGGFWYLFKSYEYEGTPIVETRNVGTGTVTECSLTAQTWFPFTYSKTAVFKPGKPATDPGGTNGPGNGDGGTVNTVPVDNPITISVKATRFQRGRYVVRWNAKSRDGKTVKVTVPKFGSRKCVPRTRTSCVVVGLRPGKTYKVVFVGKTSVATKKVNFSIKAR
ncbi:MAG: hypothetical protein RJB57_395 [Actinomycetota bacterium]